MFERFFQSLHFFGTRLGKRACNELHGDHVADFFLNAC
jgi:hypothetical protein